MSCSRQQQKSYISIFLQLKKERNIIVTIHMDIQYSMYWASVIVLLTNEGKTESKLQSISSLFLFCLVQNMLYRLKGEPKWYFARRRLNTSGCHGRMIRMVRGSSVGLMDSWAMLLSNKTTFPSLMKRNGRQSRSWYKHQIEIPLCKLKKNVYKTRM